MIWATVEHYGWDELRLPEGCESVSYGGYGNMGERRTMHVVRVADKAALLRLVDQLASVTHAPDECSGTGTFHVTSFDDVGVTFTCDVCATSWSENYDDNGFATRVPTYRTKRAAMEAADDFGAAGFFGSFE